MCEKKQGAGAFYIKQLNAFHKRLQLNDFPKIKDEQDNNEQDITYSEVLLWYAFMHLNNMAYWAEWFDASYSALALHSKLCKRAVQNAIPKLIKRKLIEVIPGATKTSPNHYRIIPLFDIEEDDATDTDNKQTEKESTIAPNAIASDTIASNATASESTIARDATASGSTIASDATYKYINTEVNTSSASASDKASNVMTKKQDPFFSEFWECYPRKKNEKAAKTAWKKIRPDADLARRIIEAVKANAETSDWKKNNGQFVPYPSTFLNGEQWKNKITTSSDPTDDYYDRY